MVAPVKRCQSPTSTASPTRSALRPRAGSPAGPPPAPRSAWPPAHRSRHPAAHGGPARPVPHRAPCQSDPQGRAGAAPPSPAAASAHAPGPRTVLPDQPVAQQQLRQPLPGPHQIGAGVFPGPHQIPRRLSATAGTRTAGTSPMCNRRASRSASRRSVLTRSPVAAPAWTAPHHALHPGRPKRPGQTQPAGPGLIGHRHRARQQTNPPQDRLGGRR